MAIDLRGTLNHITGRAGNGANITLVFDTITPPLEDDIVVVFGGHGIAVTTLAAPGTGYTQIGKHETTAPIFGMWYKRMGSTPDLSVVCDGGGSNQDGVAYGCYVLSGVDTTTAEDQTATTAGPTTSTNPDAPSITTQTANAWVIPVAGGDIRDTSPGTVSGYSNQLNEDGNDTNDLTIAGATFENVGADAENPPAWDTWSSSTWYAITAAFKVATAGETASGSPSLTKVTSTGVSVIEKQASGSPNITKPTSAGTALQSSPPVVTDVNATETWDDGDTGLVITGTGFV